MQVFTRPELEAIAELCVRHDLIALSDEVYEHLVFGGAAHVSLRSLPGMKERCVRLGSAGKTFSFTAWKVGGAGGGGGRGVWGLHTLLLSKKHSYRHRGGREQEGKGRGADRGEDRW